MWRYRKDEAVYKLSRDKDVFSKPCKEPYLWKYFREITHTFIHKITIPMNMKTLTICKIDKRPDFFISSILGERSDKRSFELSIQYTTQGSKKKLFFITNTSLSDVNADDNGAYISTRGTGRKYTIINKKDFNRKD